MQLSTLLNGLLAMSAILLGASAIPQPDLLPRQQTTTSLSTASTSSTFTSTVNSQCYTSRVSTPLARRATTTSSTSFTSAQSTTTVRTTSPVTPRARTATVTSTATVNSTITNYNGTVATTTTTNTRLQTTTTTITKTTGTTTTTTISTTMTSTIPAPAGFIPVTSSLPRPRALKRHIHASPLLHRRQRGGNRPGSSFGRNRRSYPGDVSCLTILATGTVETRTQTQRSTLQPSTKTITRTTTVTSRTTVFPPSSPTPTSTVTVSTTTTSSVVFTRTAIQTTTDTVNITSSTSTTIYAACTDPANRVSRLTNYDNKPIDGVTFDYIPFSGDNSSAYACCVSTILNGNGAIWAYSGDGACYMGRVDGTQSMCVGGQSAQSATLAKVLAGQVGGPDDYIVGNGYCGAWNTVG